MSVHITKEERTLCGLQTPSGVNWPYIRFNDLMNLDTVDCWRCICIHLGKPIPTEPPMPEHDKVTASHDLPQKLCEFIKEFLYEKGISLAQIHHHSDACRPNQTVPGLSRRQQLPRAGLSCGWQDGEMYPHRGNLVALAAEFIGVDKKKYDAEKDAALKCLQTMNDLQDWAKTEGHMMLATAASRPRCDKLAKIPGHLNGYLCDDEPGHGGGRCWSTLHRRA